MTGSNKRKYIRTKMRANVTLSHPQAGELNLQTGDISDGGAYILTSAQDQLAVGDIVSVQVQGMGSGEAPKVKMRVVRTDKDGIGLQFVTDEEA